MRILTLCYEYPPIGGGGGRIAAKLAESFVTKGHSTDVFTMGYKNLPSEEIINGVRVHRVGNFRRREDSCSTLEMIAHLYRVLPRILDHVRHNNYDVIHAHFIVPNGIAASIVQSRTGLPLVITAHGSDIPGYNPDRFRLAHILIAPLWKCLVAKPETIVCPSEHLLDLLHKRNVADLNSCIIPNGIDIDKYSADKPKLRRSILVVTRVVKRKGVQFLLQALKDYGIDAEVNIVGDGPYMPTLRHTADSLGVKVNFLGWLDNESDELRELYESSEIFVFTSLQENFPVNLLEAMIAGMAIITSNSSGTVEVVGDTGILIEPGNIAALGEALTELIDKPEKIKEFGLRARKRVEAHFDREIIQARYLELFAAAISDHPQTPAQKKVSSASCDASESVSKL